MASRSRYTSLISLFAASVVLLIGANAQAQTLFVPVEFGASFEPKQLNEQLIESGTAYGQYDMLSQEERDEKLDIHFPELTRPNISDLEQLFASGRDAYFAGEFGQAEEELTKALDAATERLVALTLRPGFAESTYQGGLYLIQNHYFAMGNPDAAEKIIDRLVRLFPTQVPDESEFPPDLVELYKSYLPTGSTGKTLTIVVGDECYARLNGKELEAQESTNIVVLPGSYGIVEVCQEQPTRAFVVPVTTDTIVDFHDTFADNFTYPISTGVNAREKADSAYLTDVLIQLGERVGAKYVIGAGLVPDVEGDGYRAILVDVGASKLMREAIVPPSEVTTTEGMTDLLNHLWTGEEFAVISDTVIGSVDWTLVGAITAGVGGAIVVGAVVTALLAQSANDEFFKCNADAECRLAGDDTEHLKSRSRLSIIADVLYGTGAAFVVAGAVMIIVDLTSGGSSGEAEPTAAGDWQLGVAPTSDGGGFIDLRVAF